MSEGRRGGREARRAVRTSMAVRCAPGAAAQAAALRGAEPRSGSTGSTTPPCTCWRRSASTSARTRRWPTGRDAGATVDGAARPHPARAADGSGRARRPSASRCTPATRPSRPRSAATRMVFGPTYGSPFVRGFDGERRYGTIEDLNNFHKLAYMAPALQNTGAGDLRAGRRRHPQAAPAHHRLGDPPQRQELHGPGDPPDRAEDAVRMCEIVFGTGVRPRQRGHGGPGQRQLAAGLGRHHDRRAAGLRPLRPGAGRGPVHAGRRQHAGLGHRHRRRADGRGAVRHRLRPARAPGCQDDPGQLPRRRVDEVRRAHGRHRRARPDEPDDRPARPPLHACPGAPPACSRAPRSPTPRPATRAPSTCSRSCWPAPTTSCTAPAGPRPGSPRPTPSSCSTPSRWRCSGSSATGPASRISTRPSPPSARSAPAATSWAPPTPRPTSRTPSSCPSCSTTTASSSGWPTAPRTPTTRGLEAARKTLDGYVAPPLDPGVEAALADFIARRERELPDHQD